MMTVLVIDDEENVRNAISRILGREDYQVNARPSAEDGLALLASEPCDLVLCDIRLTGMDGLAFQSKVRVDHPDIPVIMITAYADVETAVRALKQGAYDYLSKPFSAEELRKAVWRALETRRLRLENVSLQRVVHEFPGLDVWTGESGVMNRLYADAARVASSRAAVFVSGESGSGKEILARYIHVHSPRSDQVFLAVNCATLPEALADSHLFGHVRGAFTGAVSEQKGYLEVAHGGTLFLDEIEDLKLDVQAKLLRVLEDGKVRRLGGSRENEVDVRFLTAAQKAPEQLVKDGKLREDLFFRLSAIHLRVPPLRRRSGDIVGLSLHFLRRFSKELKKSITGLDPDAAEQLQHYSWPGNVRELRNVMERASIYVDPGKAVSVADLPRKVRGSAEEPSFVVAAQDTPTLDAVTRRYISFVLRMCDNHQTRAARILGISPSTLWRHRRQQESDRPEDS